MTDHHGLDRMRDLQDDRRNVEQMKREAHGEELARLRRIAHEGRLGTDGFEHPRDTAQRWIGQAEANVEEWGLQSEETLLLATQEELGELTQAHLEADHEDGDGARIAEELDDLAALLFQLRWALAVREGSP